MDAGRLSIGADELEPIAKTERISAAAATSDAGSMKV
jgi:hypothetical protein